MNTYRTITDIVPSEPTIEGAGVHLKRAFGFAQKPNLDPFLLLDDFHSANPDDYIAGFPWHPHRGIETVTYMITGAVEHGDSIGNRGVIGSGDVQWMTAGSGIIHQEMPQAWEGMMQGFQLWVNLPAEKKMIAPRYREVKAAEIPQVKLNDGVRTKIIAGELGGATGPVRDLVVPCSYFDVQMEAQRTFEFKPQRGYRAFAYVFAGSGRLAPDAKKETGADHLVVWNDEGDIQISSGDEGLRFLIATGKPLNEPVAWRGPIVMNTREELDLAFREFREGTFIKHKISQPIPTDDGCEYYRGG